MLVFGTICIDRLRRVPSLPPVGGYVEIESEVLMLGGEAANTANALRSWGHDILLAGNATGAGPDGESLRTLLAQHDLPTAHLGPPGEVIAPICDVFITPDGERTMFGRGFASSHAGIAPPDLPFAQAQWLTAEPNLGAPAREVAQLAIAAGLRTYLMDFLHEDDPIAPGSFWQCSTDWAGKRGDVQRNVTWVQEWVNRFGCHTILSDGPGGFVFGSPTHSVRHYPPFPAPRVVDTTGAGDMFRAGMLHGLDSGWPIERCLQFASAAGCLKCGYLGATGTVPTEAEVLAHIAANPEVAERYSARIT